MNKRIALIAILVAAVGALLPHVVSAQAAPDADSPRVGFRLLHSFEGRPQGAVPIGLVQANDGNFYGVTAFGGRRNKGTVFRLRPGGAVATLHHFSGVDGDDPYGGLIQARDGNLYGSPYLGGAFGYGTLFRVTPDGQLTTLHSFSGADLAGQFPREALVEASDGNLYGITSGACVRAAEFGQADDVAVHACGPVVSQA